MNFLSQPQLDLRMRLQDGSTRERIPRAVEERNMDHAGAALITLLAGSVALVPVLLRLDRPARNVHQANREPRAGLGGDRSGVVQSPR